LGVQGPPGKNFCPKRKRREILGTGQGDVGRGNACRSHGPPGESNVHRTAKKGPHQTPTRGLAGQGGGRTLFPGIVTAEEGGSCGGNEKQVQLGNPGWFRGMCQGGRPQHGVSGRHEMPDKGAREGDKIKSEGKAAGFGKILATSVLGPFLRVWTGGGRGKNPFRGKVRWGGWVQKGSELE